MTYLEYCHHCVSHVDSLCVRLGTVCRSDDDPRKMRYQENRPDAATAIRTVIVLRSEKSASTASSPISEAPSIP